jgi:hypothetical protein
MLVCHCINLNDVVTCLLYCFVRYLC